MKQGTLITRIIILVLFLGIAAYFGVYVWSSLTSGITTTTAYSYTAERKVTSTGWFFRDEAVLEDASELAEVLRTDGEAVAVGDTVARIYSSDEGYAVQKQLDEAQSNLSSLKYILSRTSESADTIALDDDIADAFADLHYSVASGDLSDLDTDADELRGLIFRRDYTYNGTDSLQTQIDEAQAQVDALRAQSSSAYTPVSAPAAGLFSSAVDGFEAVMTTAALEGLTPGGLDGLSAQADGTPSDSIGKIITSSGWYFSCNLTEQEAEDLYAGASVTLRFRDTARSFPATVKRVSDPEDGRVNVTFYGSDYAAQVAALREQEVTVVTETATGFRVPKRAVRVNQDESLDSAGQLGVYRVSGAQAKWVPVNIIWEEDDFYLVTQAYDYETDENGKTTQVAQSEFDKASNLRAGDTIIVRGENIYNGKVVTD